MIEAELNKQVQDLESGKVYICQLRTAINRFPICGNCDLVNNKPMCNKVRCTSSVYDYYWKEYRKKGKGKRDKNELSARNEQKTNEI